MSYRNSRWFAPLLVVAVLVVTPALAATIEPIDSWENVPAGETVTVPADGVFSALGNVHVAGTLVGASGASSWARVLHLHAEGWLVVDGLIDVRVPTTLPDVPEALAGNSIILSAGKGILIGPKAIILAGKGGDGASAVASYPGTSAVAQHGGAGGFILLDAPSIMLEGKLVPGDGGQGGSASGFAGADAIAGHGGDGGLAILRSGLKERIVAGGNGGNGGSATTIGDACFSCAFDAPSVPAGPRLTLDVIIRTPKGVPLLDCGADKVGADGGTGWGGPAGHGESVDADGCKGRNGDRGADGSEIPEAAPLFCTDGGNGSDGSPGTTGGRAQGGNGGNAFITGDGRARPGNGGYANSIGGQGGAGGAGGNAGNAALMKCNGGSGGAGGKGGTGGNANGGHGGIATAPVMPVYTYCGIGGKATSQGGAGGTGGPGGMPEGTSGPDGAQGDEGQKQDGENCPPWVPGY